MTSALLRSRMAGLAALALSLLSPPAVAEGGTTVTAVYGVSVGSFGVATLSLDASINDQGYRLAGAGQVTGFATMISSARGSTRSSGAFGGSRVLPAQFAHEESSTAQSVSINIDMSRGDVQKVRLQPEPAKDAKRVPVLPQHLRNILDPLSAILVRMPGGEPLVSDKACNRSIPVFSGWHRFDIVLSYRGTREVRTEQGYAGPVVVCEARYRPIAGHRPKASIKRTEDARIEIWLAPVEGTRVLLPYRAEVDTVLGRGVLQARRFEASLGERRISVK